MDIKTLLKNTTEPMPKATIEEVVKSKKKRVIYKPKLFRYVDDNEMIWFELAYFTNYGKKNQSIKFKSFNTRKQAEDYLNKFQVL
jgi:hypothetical protein